MRRLGQIIRAIVSGRFIGVLFAVLGVQSLLAADVLTAAVWGLLAVAVLIYQPRPARTRAGSSPRWMGRNVAAAGALVLALVLFIVLLALRVR